MPTAVPDSVKPSAAPWLGAVGIALALSGAFLAWRHWPGPAPALPPSGQMPSASRIDDKVPLPAFALHRSNGIVSNVDLLGHWTLLNFGYASCPQICPTTLATLREVKARIASKGKTVPQVIFVSVDPERDTPTRLATFMLYFDSRFIGATGTDLELAALTRHLGVAYQRHDAQDKEHYEVDHGTAVYLIDPQGRLKATFSWPHDSATMAADFAKLTAGG
ncbi:MAG: SCO family protein [Gammaproteobacteria bacterium]|nr:SCO family protein [Gammaproteobacteria bacterium]MBU1416626.1 SCO family protein [Gammaproteobacteria bacterium]